MKPAIDTPGYWSGRSVAAALMCFLALSLGYFLWRGVCRAPGDSRDLMVGFTAAKAWLSGANPYVAGALRQTGQLAGVSAIEAASLDELANVYFPPTILIFLTVCGFSWQVAKVIWLIASIAAIAGMIWGLITLARIQRPWITCFVGMALALTSLHAALSSAQTTIPAVTCLVFAAVLERRGRTVMSGLFYGLATVAKVQIGLPFIAYIVWRRRWPTAAGALGLAGGLSLLSIAVMNARGIPWFATWSENLQKLSASGGLNDPSLANYCRSSLLGLSVLLHNFIDSSRLVTLLACSLVGLAALRLVWRIRGKYPSADYELQCLAIVACLTLLVSYHRVYDGVLMVFPLALAMKQTGWLRLATLVCFVILLFPLQAFFHLLGMAHVYGLHGDEILWQASFLGSHTWAIIAITFLSFRYRPVDSGPDYSTVTLLARLRGLSTLQSRATAA